MERATCPEIDAQSPEFLSGEHRAESREMLAGWGNPGHLPVPQALRKQNQMNMEMFTRG